MSSSASSPSPHSGPAPPARSAADAPTTDPVPTLAPGLASAELAGDAAAQLALLGAAVREAGEAVLITTAEVDVPGPRIVFANPAAVRLTGYAVEELVGRTPRMLQGPTTDRAELDRVRAHLERGTPFSGRVVNYRKDGTEYVIDWHIAPVRVGGPDATAAVTHFVSVQRDVTAEVRAGEERDHLLAVAEAARGEAERAQAAAEAANRAKSEFLAAMSHEIRTPINAQIGYADLLDIGVAGPLTEPQRAYLARLTASSRHLLGIVDDVLDLAQVDAGALAIQQARARTGAAVAAALDLVHPQAEAKGVRLVDVRVGDEGEPYVGDEHRVRQVLLNLLANAIKFTPAGGTVRVACGRAHDGPHGPAAPPTAAGPWTTVTVEDTGAGIPPEAHARIFEPFQQVHAHDGARAGSATVYTRTHAGTGLGLAISRRLARLMGGDLTLDRSTPGAGSAFTLWLPAGGTAGVAAGEGAAAQDAAARDERTTARAPAPLAAVGLDRVGARLREGADAVLRAYTARLRADPATPGARALARAQLEDHQATLLADLAQSLVIVGGTTAQRAQLLADGSAIQRVIAEHHGARRHAQGWTEAAVARDLDVLAEEVERAVRAGLAAGAETADEALGVLRQLLARGRAQSLVAWRRAAGGAPG